MSEVDKNTGRIFDALRAKGRANRHGLAATALILTANHLPIFFPGVDTLLENAGKHARAAATYEKRFRRIREKID